MKQNSNFKKEMSYVHTIYEESNEILWKYKKFAKNHCINELWLDVTEYARGFDLSNDEHHAKAFCHLGADYMDLIDEWNEWQEVLGEAQGALDYCDFKLKRIYEKLYNQPCNSLRLPFAKKMLAAACKLLEVADELDSTMKEHSDRDCWHKKYDDFEELLSYDCRTSLYEVEQTYTWSYEKNEYIKQERR
jgi:hypothetical protein